MQILTELYKGNGAYDVTWQLDTDVLGFIEPLNYVYREDWEERISELRAKKQRSRRHLWHSKIYFDPVEGG